MDSNNIQDPSAPVRTDRYDEQEVERKNKMLFLAIVVTVVVLVALAIVGFIFLNPGPDTVQGQGEATEIRISGKLPGRVAEIYVTEGQHVKAGDTLVHIHSSVVDAQRIQAEAMEQVAKATDNKVDAGTRAQIIQSAYDMWQQAAAAKGIAQKTYERMQNLYREGVVSEQKRDEAKAAFEATTAQEQAAKSQYELAKAGAQKEDKQAAAAALRAAQGGVDQVDAILEDQYLLAPYDGEITVIYPNQSELVATGAPIMSLQRDDHFAVFNVRETLLKDLKVGSKIRVKIPALDKEVDMKVFYVRDLGSYANWQATKATGDFDARTFQVKARPEKPIEGFRPGMSVIIVQ